MNYISKNINYHFLLNLDYPLDYKGINLDTQTNQLINLKINELINLFKTNQTKTFIYEYRDDLISLIGLKIMNLAANLVHTNFYCYGPHKNTKEFIKKEKFISKFKLKRNLDKIYFISSFNSIYKVTSIRDISKKFDLKYNNIFKLMKNFTPQEIIKAAEFYNISQEDYIEDFNLYTLNYQKWIENPLDLDQLRNIQLIEQIENYQQNTSFPQISAVWLTGDIDLDRTILDECTQSDNLIFYYSDTKDLPIYKDYSFDCAIKFKDNIPKKFNINQQKKIINEINISRRPIKILGKWPIEKYQEFTKEA